jgi:hypothetical protein
MKANDRSYFFSTDDRIGGSDAKKEWLRCGDFANFAGAWWPYAGAEELKTLAQLTIWVSKRKLDVIAMSVTPLDKNTLATSSLSC